MEWVASSSEDFVEEIVTTKSATGRVDVEVNVQRAENVPNWSLEGDTPMAYEYLLSNKDTKFHNIKLCFVQLQIPEEVGFVDGKLLIKIEIANESRHEKKSMQPTHWKPIPAARLPLGSLAAIQTELG
jgi:hypothetical protein